MPLKNELVSVITPLYNIETFIERTIRTVIDQTYPHWEMIIIDDCSVDKSCEVVERLQKEDSRIKLIRLKQNVGAAMARNEGIKYSSGRYIAFLDGDDLWLPEKLQTQVDFMLENDLALTYSAYYAQRGEYRTLRKIPLKATFNTLLLDCYIGCLTAIYDAQKLGKVYMPSRSKRHDWALWLHILRQIKSTKGIPVPLAIYTLREDSLSSNKFKLIKHNWIVLRRFKTNIFSASFIMGLFLVKNVTKLMREKWRFAVLKRKMK